MKFSLLTTAGVLAAISQATAVTVVTPWANTVWTANGHGLISWNFTSAEAHLKCDIYMLNGEMTNSNIVAHVTNPATPVNCSAGSYDMYPLNNFAPGSYWIRMGQASTSTWAYSSPFRFNGTGTAHPISVVSGTPSPTGNHATATGTVAAAAAADASGKPTSANNGTAVGNKAAGSPSSGASGAISMNAASVGLGVIAAVALAL